MFDREVLPAFLSRMRWFEEHEQPAISASVAAVVPFADHSDTTAVPWLAIVDTHKPQVGRYLIPMQIDWTKFDRERFNPNALAAVRQGSREGTLLDIATSPAFVSLLLDNMRNNASTEAFDYRLEFSATGPLAEKPLDRPWTVWPIEVGHASTTLQVDDKYIVKLQRRLEIGVDPGIEVGSFLTGVAGFAHTPALLGTVKLVRGSERTAVGSVHAFVQNQGDAWAVTVSYLDRFIDEQNLPGATPSARDSDERTSYQRYMELTGRRVAEMQTALASRDDIEDFRPVQATPDDLRHLIDNAVRLAERTFERIHKERRWLPEADQALASQVGDAAPAIRACLRRLLPASCDWMNIRHHGDLHLAQILVVKDDISIINLEGSPNLPLEDRRQKAPAARDVATLIRSIDYSVEATFERTRKVRADDPGKLRSMLDGWRAQSITTFLDAYRASLKDERLWPADTKSRARMLRFFQIEKALQEIDHELTHRPDWARLPLTALLRLIDDSQAADAPFA